MRRGRTGTVGAKGWGGVLVMSTVSDLEYESFLRWTVVMSARQCKYI